MSTATVQFVAAPQTAADVDSNRQLLIALKSQVADAGVSDAALIGAFDTLIVSATDSLAADIDAHVGGDGRPVLIDAGSGKINVSVRGADGHSSIVEDDPVPLASIPHIGAAIHSPPTPPPPVDTVPGGGGTDPVIPPSPPAA